MGLTQKEVAEKTGLSRSTISELEAGLRENISIPTLKKLISVLDPNIILDDYLTFILEQESNICDLINKYGKNKISKILKCHISTVERYANNTSKFPPKKFNLLKPYL